MLSITRLTNYYRRPDGEEASFDDCVDKFYDHLSKSLQLPCDVTGIAEIKAVDKKSVNYQLLDDYTVWFVNNR